MTRRFSDLTRLLPLAAALVSGPCLPLAAQIPGQPAPLPPPAPAQFDPSDVYFQGWLLTRDAEAMADEGKFLEALEKLRRSKQLFDNIKRQFPDWKPNMVGGRIEKTIQGIAKVTPGALEEQDEKERVLAELEGGTRTGAVTGNAPKRLDTGLNEVEIAPLRSADTLASRRITELQAEVTRLQRQIEASGTPNGAAREAARANETERQRDLARSQLKQVQDELQQLRKRYAEAPMHDEIRGLSDRIQGLERENAAMGQALTASQAEAREAKGQVEALQQERARLLQQEADLKRNLELERNVANDVVAGQQKQLKLFQEQLRKKDIELAESQQKIQLLESELAEVRAEFTDLREERDTLLREKDQMAALLKLNEAGQIQQLVDQNMSLAKELRESAERYDLLRADNDATKDDLLESLRDLAITKLKIQEFRREKAEQDKRLANLEQRLRRERNDLDTSDADPAEAAALRGIISRQLRIQDKRREARELLIEALDDKARGDNQIQQALALFQGAELNLSPEELRLVEDQHVDGVIVSPYARPRSEVAASLAALNQDLAPFTKAGDRAYLSNRYLAAREAYNMILERHPGETGTMCKLGLVELRLDDPLSAAMMFRQVTELDTKNPYAHRMLGYTLMQIDDNIAALDTLGRAVTLAPTNPEGHIVIGNLHFRLGNTAAAEESFKTAVACDETSPEPHYNLAFLYAREGAKDEGLEHYRRALDLGAPPNLDLEKRLAK